MDEVRRRGAWLAGYASYELGYVLEPKLAGLMPENRRVPLLQFGVFDQPVAAADLPAADASLSAIRPKWTAEQYAERIAPWPVASGAVISIRPI